MERLGMGTFLMIQNTCATLRWTGPSGNENCRKIILGHARQGVTDGIYTQKDIQDLLEINQ